MAGWWKTTGRDALPKEKVAFSLMHEVLCKQETLTVSVSGLV
jgi:hypothetical protein